MGTQADTRTSRHTAIAAVAGLNALAAWGGAAALVAGLTDFGDRLNDRLPYDSPVLAGVALAVVVAIPLSMLAAAAWTGHHRTDEWALAAGATLVAWIVLQILVLRSLSVLQAVYLTIGAYFIASSHRLRLGTAQRGALLISVGALAIAVGVGLLPHLVDDTISLGAALSLMLSAGGLAAVVLGARSLLGSRTMLQRVGGGAVIVLVVALTAWIVTPAVAATNVTPSAITTTPADLGIDTVETLEITTADDVRLAAWYLPGTSEAAVVVLHGAGSTRSEALDHAAVLHRNGFGVLMLDARGHGDSGGTAMDFGWYGDLDVAAAVDHLLTIDTVDPDRIGVLGLSMGGEEAIGAGAAHDSIRAVVAEGATARTAADKSWLSDAYGWRGWLQEQIERVQFGVTDLLTEAAPPATLASSVRDAEAAFLLITAGRVPDERHAAEHLEAAAPDRVTVWTVDDAGHTGGLDVDPTEWERRVIGFLDDHLGRPTLTDTTTGRTP